MARQPVADVRVVAVRLLQSLRDGGGSLTVQLPTALAQVSSERRGLLQSLVYDLARWSTRLEALVDALLAKPLKRKDTDIYLALQLGVMQLDRRRMPDHAAIDTAVDLAVPLGKPWARALINGVLRNFQRQRDSLIDNLSDNARLAHPSWWLDHLRDDWPDHWRAIAEANNRQGPMTLRVNRRQHTRDRWQASLGDTTSYRLPMVPDALVLEAPCAVEALPGFSTGAVSVQDAAAQLAAVILGAADGGRLLDACAAPGGKTAHALEYADWRQVVALDKDGGRLQRVSQNMQRLSLERRVLLLRGDAAQVTDWWDGEAFDAILLDAPCSGSGVIRRHPDIKLLRRASDIAPLVREQQRLLQALWPLLKPGGRLLYATCSVLKDENERQIALFLASDIGREEAVAVDPVDAAGVGDWGRVRPLGRQLLPGDHASAAPGGMDGFYYALLHKRP